MTTYAGKSYLQASAAKIVPALRCNDLPQQIAWAAFRDYQRDVFLRGHYALAFERNVAQFNRTRTWRDSAWQSRETFRVAVADAYGIYEYLVSTIA